MNFHYEVGQRFLETNGKHDAEWTIDTANAAFKKEAIKKAGIISLMLNQEIDQRRALLSE